MNTPVAPLVRPNPSQPQQAGEGAAIDQLLQEYLVWNAEALDVLVALYEAIDSGGGAPPEAARFASRIGAWEDRLSEVLGRMESAGRGTQARIAAMV